MDEKHQRSAVGARIRDAREYAGYSQEEVARFLKVPRWAISLIESGSRRLDILEVAKLARLLSTTVSYLTGEEGDAGAEPESIRLVARATAELDAQDRAEVLRFAEFLRVRKSTGES